MRKRKRALTTRTVLILLKKIAASQLGLMHLKFYHIAGDGSATNSSVQSVYENSLNMLNRRKYECVRVQLLAESREPRDPISETYCLSAAIGRCKPITWQNSYKLKDILFESDKTMNAE